jgi:hypothetical protein
MARSSSVMITDHFHATVLVETKIAVFRDLVRERTHGMLPALRAVWRKKKQGG